MIHSSLWIWTLLTSSSARHCPWNLTTGILKSSLKKIQPIQSSRLASYSQHIYKQIYMSEELYYIDLTPLKIVIYNRIQIVKKCPTIDMIAHCSYYESAKISLHKRNTKILDKKSWLPFSNLNFLSLIIDLSYLKCWFQSDLGFHRHQVTTFWDLTVRVWGE